MITKEQKRVSGPGGAHLGMFGRPTMLMAPVGDEGGGGGGDDEDKPITITRKGLITLINETFHRAFGEREKRLTKSLSDTLNKALGEKMDDLRKALIDDTEPPPSGGREDERGGGGQIPAHLQAELTASKRAAEEAKAEGLKLRQEIEAERAKGMRAEERQKLTAALTGRVKGTLLDVVVNDLHSKHLVRDPETGDMLWKTGQGDETVPFEAGIDAWGKTDYAKEVSPPRDVGGSGGRSPQGGRGNQPMDSAGVADAIFGGRG